MHPEIKKEDILTFSERYRGSEEEEEDLLEYYDDNDGDISKILCTIMVS